MFAVVSRAATPFLCLAALLLVAPAFALTGIVIDDEGEPIEGARVCFFVDNVETLCTLTTDAGFFELPDSEMDTIRIVATGFLPLALPAVEQDGPIPLKPAASVMVRVIDAKSGEGVAESTVEILHASGRVRRFPANRVGVRVRSYEPGLVTVTARAEGYRPGEPLRVELEAGREAEVEIRLEPDGEAASSEDPATPGPN